MGLANGVRQGMVASARSTANNACLAGKGRSGGARSGWAWRGTARCGSAGAARYVEVWLGTLWQVLVWSGEAGMVCNGKLGYGMVS